MSGRRKLNSCFAVLRVMATIGIVVHHCILALGGGWPPNSPVQMTLPKVLWRIDSLAVSFGMNVFVFLAGWFAFVSLLKECSMCDWLIAKVKRLLIPCAIAGVVYWLVFPQFLYNRFPAAINGTHLWFLPMLFCCFAILAVFRKLMAKVQFSSGGAGKVLAWMIAFVILKVFRFLFPIRTIVELSYWFPIFFVGYFAASYNEVRIDFDCESRLPGLVMLLNRHSFSIYILHQFMINSVILMLPMAPIARWEFRFVVLLAASLGGSLLLCVIFDFLKGRLLWRKC